MFPNHIAVIHGSRRFTYAEFYARARRLASALAAHGIGPGDTVSVMLQNTPPMLEAHYGVPMTGGVLHALNTRLDPALIAFQLDHAESKVVICDREFAGVMRQALAQAKVKPLVIDYDDAEFPQAAEPLSATDYEAFLAKGDPGFRLAHAGRRVAVALAQLHVRHHRQSQGRGLQPPRRRAHVLLQRALRQPRQAPGLSVDAADVPLQRLVLSLDHRRRDRHPRVPALGAGESRCSMPSPSTR